MGSPLFSTQHGVDMHGSPITVDEYDFI